MPKVSQLLTRVLAREHDDRDDASSSSASEENYGLQQMAANASAGLRMEMEMVRESRARDAKDGVDRNACIVDRNQFFNTQIGVGYQHKTVVRQRTAEPESNGQRVIDMSVARLKEKRHRSREREREADGGSESDDGGDGGKTKSSKSGRRKKSEKRKKGREGDKRSSKKQKKNKKDKRDKKSSRHRESGKSSRRSRHAKGDSSDDDSGTKKGREGSSSRSRKHKKNSGSKHNGRKHASRGGTDRGDVDEEMARKSSSCSSSSESSDSGGDSGDALGPSQASDSCGLIRPPQTGGDGGRTDHGNTMTALDRAKEPLQRLRNLIEEKLRAKARESKAKGVKGEQGVTVEKQRHKRVDC